MATWESKVEGVGFPDKENSSCSGEDLENVITNEVLRYAERIGSLTFEKPEFLLFLPSKSQSNVNEKMTKKTIFERVFRDNKTIIIIYD